MTGENDAAAVAADAAATADFAAGFAEEAPKTIPPEKHPPEQQSAPSQGATKHAREGTRTAREGTEPARDAPEYVQISRKEWDETRAAHAKLAGYDQQLSKAFGALGNQAKLINELRTQQPATPTLRKIEIPKDAFAEMQRDFPELAQQISAALEKSLSGLSGTGAADADPAKLESLVAEITAKHTAKHEMEKLDDAHPGWREIVGATDAIRERPNQANPFRKWLTTKDAAYQTRINSSLSAAVIGRAINLFRTETKASGKPGVATENRSPHDQARADRIRGAVQPRGDAGAAGKPNDDDEFLAGFNSR